MCCCDPSTQVHEQREAENARYHEAKAAGILEGGESNISVIPGTSAFISTKSVDEG